MKQYEAVIEALKQNGGYATLGQLYQDTLKIPNWNGKQKHLLRVFGALSKTATRYLRFDQGFGH